MGLWRLFTVNASNPTIHFEPTGDYYFRTVSTSNSMPEAHIVTAISAPGGILTASLTGSSPNSFTLSTEKLPVYTIMTAIKLVVVPKSGLTVGTHTATVTVDASDGFGNILSSGLFNVTITIKEY